MDYRYTQLASVLAAAAPGRELFDHIILFENYPVQELVAQLLPLVAAFQLFDSLAASCNGILRGLGRQEIGGYVNLFAYYAVRLR